MKTIDKRNDIRTATDVIKDLVEKHQFDFVLDSCHMPGKYYAGRIGEVILKRTSEADRELLKNLKSEDFKDVRPLEYVPFPNRNASNMKLFIIPHEKP